MNPPTTLAKNVGKTEQRQVECGVFGVSRVGEIRRDEAGAAEHERDDNEPGKKIKSEYREAERHATDAETGEDHSDDVKTLMLFGPNIGNVSRREDYTEQADRNVDEKDPVPGRVRGDKAADWRSQYGADQSRSRHPGHRPDQFALADRAHHHHAADRGHHRAAHSLNDAGDDEVGE